MPNGPELVVNGMNFDWEPDAGNLNAFGIPSVLFWLNPSLYRMLEPLVEVCGGELYRLLVAHESSKGTEEDYHAMVTTLGSTFPEGFVGWGKAVGAAGWGSISLPEFEPERRHARVRIENPWELKLVVGTGEYWGCPFMQGKIIGLFTHAFGVTCWAQEEHVVMEASRLSVEFRVYEADKTIAGELERLRLEQRSSRERQMQDAVEQATREQQAQLELVKRQRSVIRRLSTPLIQVWEGVLVLPLIGEIDSERADDLTERTLEAVTERSARYVILDLTGVSEFGAEAAGHVQRTIAAARLLGARSMLTGVSPQTALALVEVDTLLGKVPSYATLQDALEHVIRS